jgi:N-acetylglucosamine-6-phosphate deacetylase
LHGAVRCDETDADVIGLQAMSMFCAWHGVTDYLSTTWAGDRARTVDALGAISDEMLCPLHGPIVRVDR